MRSKLQSCPKRMNEIGPWEQKPNLDHWEKRGPDLVCSFCGSLYPEEFLKLCDKTDGVKVNMSLSDKRHKVYIRRPEIINATQGAIKFYLAHLKPGHIFREAETKIIKALQISAKASEKQIKEVMESFRESTKLIPSKPRAKKRQTHKHKEAFCIMSYKGIDSCGHEILIWNSRDGVTPFVCRCPICFQGELTHVNWHLDLYKPNLKLKEGMFYWDNMRFDEFKEATEDMVEKFWGSRRYPLHQRYESKEKAVELMAKEFKEGQPIMRKHGEEKFTRKRSNGKTS